VKLSRVHGPFELVMTKGDANFQKSINDTVQQHFFSFKAVS